MTLAYELLAPTKMGPTGTPISLLIQNVSDVKSLQHVMLVLLSKLQH